MIFFVGLVAGGGATAAARVNGLVKRLRDAATNTKPDTPLRDIRTLRPNELADKNKPLVVLVHGLFSTDIGTFNELEKLLTERRVVVAGFPHDSIMTSIDDNGRELAQVLCALQLNEGFARLACHSRGGLVARSTAVWLARERSQSILGGCATFGTPHCGSPLAETPGGLMAAGVILTLTQKTRSSASLVDALSCYAHANNFPGIADCQPPRHDDTYISKLQKEEGLYPDAHMPMYVVGGKRQPVGLKEWIACRALDGLDHDFVVPTNSALPRLKLGKISRTVTCDHYSYFELSQREALTEVVDFLSKLPKR
jgi:hypothetical protein